MYQGAKPKGSASKWRVLALTSLGHFTNDGMVFFVPLIVALLAVAYSVSTLLTTAALVLFYASAALAANIFGPFIDMKGLHVKGMFLGILTISIGLLLFSVALDGILVPLLLLASAMVTGIGASLYHPTGSSILQTYFRGDGHLGRYLGVNGSAGSLGRALYPSLFALVGIALASDVHSVEFFGALGVAFAVLIFYGMRNYASEGSPKSDVGQRDSDPPGDGVSSRRRGITAGVALLAVIRFIRSFAFSGIIAWLPEYLIFERGTGTTSVAAILTLMFSGGIFGQLFFGKLVEDYDKRYLLAGSTAVSALLLLLYFTTSGPLSLVALAFFGFVNFSGFPVVMSMISDYAPKGSTTSSNAFVWNLGGGSGQAIGPLLVGLMIAGAYSNLLFAFEVSLVAAFVSALMALKLPKPGRVSKVTLFG